MLSSVTDRPLITGPHDETVHNTAEKQHDKSDFNRQSIPEYLNTGSNELSMTSYDTPDLDELV